MGIQQPDPTPPVPALARGQVESAHRQGTGAPKFFCCHCRRHGKTLGHIAKCGKKRPAA
jgi:hypothetical protein